MGLCGTAVVSKGAKHGVNTGYGVGRAEAAGIVRVEVVAAVGDTHAVTARAVGHDRVPHRERANVVVYAPAAVVGGGAIFGEGGVAHRERAIAVVAVVEYAPAVVGAVC